MNKRTLKAGALVLAAAAAQILITGSIYAQAKKPAAAPAAAKPAAVKPEPAKAEPQKAEPAKAEAGKAEPAKAEPAKTEPGKAEVAPAAATVTSPDSTVKENDGISNDPSLSNSKDLLPNDYSHRPAKPKEEKLTIIGRIQMRAMSGQADTMWSTPGTDYGLVDFNFRRLRLGAVYKGDKNWGMIVHMRLENALNRATLTTTTCSTPSGGTANCATGLRDSRGIIQEANLWYDIDFMRTRITFGMINVPFAREYVTSSANLVNVERSMAIDTQQQFDNGLMINFNPLKAINKSWDRYLTIWGMIGTGNGGNGDFGIGRRADVNNNSGEGGGSNYTPVAPYFYGRAQYNIFGGLKRGDREVGWQENQEIFQRDLKVSLGYAMAGTNDTHINNPSRIEFTPRTPQSAGANQYTAATFNQSVANGTNINGTPCSPCDMRAQTADIKVSWKGLYFDGMLQYYGGAAGLNTSGITGTVGYNMHLGGTWWIMPVYRLDYMQGNFLSSATHSFNAISGPSFASNPANQITMHWFGVNLFADKHLFKLQLFYAINNNNFKGYDAAGNSLGGYKENLIILQAQGTFWTGVGIEGLPENVNY